MARHGPSLVAPGLRLSTCSRLGFLAHQQTFPCCTRLASWHLATFSSRVSLMHCVPSKDPVGGQAWPLTWLHQACA